MMYPAILDDILHRLTEVESAARMVLVGGSVRDYVMGCAVKDFDMEVYGIHAFDRLVRVLRSFGQVNVVGKSFAVAKLKTRFQNREYEFDFSFPREEVKSGPGHKGFTVTPDPFLSYAKAAGRRDFTINSIGFDIKDKVFLDPYDGRGDIERRLLRHVGPAFAEDPLRVLRAVQFAARFEFTIHPDTLALCRTLDIGELPKERIWDEFKKLLLKADKPSIGFRYMAEMGLLKYFPELDVLRGVPQDEEWHPEGDVWTHTLMVIDEMAGSKTGDEKRDMVLMLAAVCHDFGKPETTKFIDGRWRSPGHEEAGVGPALRFLARLTDEKEIVAPVTELVREHLKPALLYKDHLRQSVSDGAIRRLALRVNIPNLLLLARADHFGRTAPESLARRFDAGEWLFERASSLNVVQAGPEPLLQGRHLLEMGVAPGPQMGAMIRACFEAQLEGKVQSVEDAIEWVKTQFGVKREGV